jgi:ribosomal protein S16
MDIYEKQLIIAEILENLYNNTQIVYPMTEDKKILLITLQKTRIFLSECINLALLTEFKKGKIRKTQNPEKNLENFFKVYRAVLNQEEINSIKNLFKIAKNQRESEMDFKRKEKIIVLSKNSEYQEISMEKITKWIETGIKIYQTSSKIINKQTIEELNSQNNLLR